MRREAIRSLSFIQKEAVDSNHEEAVEISPCDSYFYYLFFNKKIFYLVIMSSLGDCVPECREEAVKNLIVIDNIQIKLILNIALRDEDFRVKRAAFNKILIDENFNELNSKSIIDILDHLLAPNQRFSFILI